ncbi:GNAT family N-acetyltransferase [Paenibacillus herberti]|uniref:GNAT family N-acetyltransferase n=2 Tax=Paenibacillus herberti TaxID=1619309 RepID=A0A229P6K3_9BACL|nr:GNAT family N-acetyltransferase [Paenibacillus herberti]
MEPLLITDSAVSNELRALQTAAYLVEARLIGFDGIPQINETHEALLTSNGIFYGCRLDGRLAGAIALEEESPGELTIDRLVVHPDFFRNGIGRFLLRQTLELYPNVDWLVSTGALNAPAIQLYLSMGFIETGRKEVAPGLEIANFRRTSGPLTDT